MISIRRRILFFIFLISFLIITPLVSLYASGYKIDLKHPFSFKMIQKTGMIIFKTDPDGATIYINEKKQEKLLAKILLKEDPIKTPAKIKGLLPGEYEIILELDGYWPWKKKITINSGQISHIQNIKLFKKDLPIQIINSSEQEISYSPDKKKVFLKKDNFLINLKTEEKTELAPIKYENDNIIWSADSKKIIIANTVFDTKNIDKTDDLNKLIGNDIRNPKWDKNNTNKLYYQYKNSLNCFDFSNNENKSLIDNENILDYLIKDNKIITISQNNFKTKLKLYSLADRNLIKEIEIPYSEKYKLINENHDLINLYDENYKTLYLINPFSLIDPLEKTIKNIKYIYWSNNDSLLYANDFEIWSLNLISDENILLTRISEQITGITKTKKTDHILYFTNQGISVLEKGDYEKIQTTELLHLDKISDSILGEEENVLYFYTKIGNQEGLYKLNI